MELLHRRGDRDDFLHELAAAIRKEPGNREFTVHRGLDDPAEFLLYEVYASEQAFREHQQTDHFKRLVLGEAAPRLARMSSTTFDAQLDVATRVAAESPELYYEIQSLNEYGGESLRALQGAVERLVAVVERRDPAGFAAMSLRHPGADRRRAGDVGYRITS